MTSLGFYGPGALVAISLGVTSAAAGTLDAYRWTARVLVIAAPGAADPRVRIQKEALASVRADVASRDLVVLEVFGDDGRSADLRRRLALPQDAFRVVLVGKDGGVKLVSEEPVPPQKLFSTIDAMPMRRDEIRRRP